MQNKPMAALIPDTSVQSDSGYIGQLFTNHETKPLVMLVIGYICVCFVGYGSVIGYVVYLCSPPAAVVPAVSLVAATVEACIDYGFFYLINHGVEEQLLQNVFDESRKFFSLPLEEKMKLGRKGDVGFAPIYAENLDSSTSSKGDLKETFHIGPLEGYESHIKNQWPSKELLPSWRFIMEEYYQKVVSVGKRLTSLIAMALNLEDDFFEKVGALDKPYAFLRLLHYPGEVGDSDEVIYGASAHSDYGMVTLLATDAVPGLQVCREKHKQPRIWEDVRHIKGAFIINLGDMMERWTNCLFRSTLHRVMPTGKERYSMALFLDPNPDCIVECLKSCCSDSSPPRFPPIRSGDHLRERINAAYSASS
ncbi:2-oxoglutarate-Fe(II) type oxidoreductase hxnY isoform X2 [Helianthus annuus]|uniref:2-oxoglutarate-Fe(II) type oxidoreductase hxnY isoform X2 n=1 Tax=Helianthus annuus TaxID=4232 RepID=UPI0016531CCF|nr:2-oxoglutarate-Fe(II) type oxidoreductase hxnY isoform X2 [Helianthus annuus]